MVRGVPGRSLGSCKFGTGENVADRGQSGARRRQIVHFSAEGVKKIKDSRARAIDANQLGRGPRVPCAPGPGGGGRIGGARISPPSMHWLQLVSEKI